MAHGVVLYVDLAHTQRLCQAFRPHKGRKADMTANGGVGIEGKKVGVAPHGEWPGRDRLAREPGCYLIVVVDNLQRPEAKLANMNGLFFVLLAAFAAA